MCTALTWRRLKHAYDIDITLVVLYVCPDIADMVENCKCRNYWNYSLHTTKQVSEVKPGIILFDSETKEIYYFLLQLKHLY